MIITKTIEETYETSLFESGAFKYIYLPVGGIIGLGALVLLIVTLFNIYGAFNPPPAPQRTQPRDRPVPTPPPTYRSVVRRERLLRLATITNLSNLEDAQNSPPCYELAVEGDLPPDYGHINLAFEPPVYEP